MHPERRLLMRVYQSDTHCARNWHEDDPAQYVSPTPKERALIDRIFDMAPDWTWMDDASVCQRITLLETTEDGTKAPVNGGSWSCLRKKELN